MTEPERALVVQRDEKNMRHEGIMLRGTQRVKGKKGVRESGLSGDADDSQSPSVPKTSPKDEPQAPLA
jgi:hypothetical protein